MNGSLSDVTTALARLRPGQITTLVEILCTSNVRQVSFVQKLFTEQSRNFSETLEFLTDIGWVRASGGELALAASCELSRMNEAQRFRAIADAMADESSPFRIILARYLNVFDGNEGTIVHRPSAQSRLEQSAIRNFLMELGLVSQVPKSDSYILDERAADLYLWARNVSGFSSKAELLRRAGERDELGIAAEIAILEFEREQVGADWADAIEHVSAKYPAACFDIKSLRVEKGQTIPRFIEVKAVPAESFQFFWTAAEIEAAALLRRSYFLYLLPVIDGGVFDLAAMEVVEDPYVTIYQSPEIWAKEERTILCRRIPISKNS